MATKSKVWLCDGYLHEDRFELAVYKLNDEGALAYVETTSNIGSGTLVFERESHGAYFVEEGSCFVLDRYGRTITLSPKEQKLVEEAIAAAS